MLRPATSSLGRRYGCRPPSEDHHLLRVARPFELGTVAVPSSVDHRPLLRPVRDQGQEGSCFAHSTAALKEFNCAKWEIAQGNPARAIEQYLSVAYLSWRTRVAMGTFPSDSGASIADAMAVLYSWGVCPETFLPYNANPSEAGDARCDVAAHPYRTNTPATVPVNADAWRQVLASGRCINVGFVVHESFEETGRDGMVPPVRPGEGVLGGHAVLVCGHETTASGDTLFTVRNSWGQGWGASGYCHFPSAYLSNVWEAWCVL